jgi:addiction module HigA family antidote
MNEAFKSISIGLEEAIAHSKKLKTDVITLSSHRLLVAKVPTSRKPTHPGEMLLQEYLVPMNISQHELALAIQVPYQRINELVNKERGITPNMALCLARYFSTFVEYWMGLQLRYDLYSGLKGRALSRKLSLF